MERGTLTTYDAPPPSFFRRWWPVVVLIPLLLVAGVVGGGWFWLVKRADTFQLTLELKTPQGERVIHITGTEVQLDETEKKSPRVVVTNCILPLRETYELTKLARVTLGREPQGKARAGTFVFATGDDEDTSSGDLDAAQASILSDFILKRSTACVLR